MIWTYTVIGSCVLVLTLATMFAIVLVIHKEKTGKGVATPFLTGLVGILLGAGGAVAGVQLMGYDLQVIPDYSSMESSDGSVAGPASPDTAMGGGGMGGMGMGGMGGGGMGGMGGGGMGGASPSPKQQLTTLVRKFDLLTGDVALHLTPEQTADVLTVVQRLPGLEKMSDEEATAFHDQLMGVLNEEQKAREAAVSLPRGRGGRGGGGGGMGGGGTPPDPDLNPFKQEDNVVAVNSILQRFGVAPTVAADAPAPAAESASEAAPSTTEAAPTVPAAEQPAAGEPAPTTSETPAAETSGAEPTPAAATEPAVQ